LGDAVYGVVSREGRPFLPPHEMREIVSGEIGSALRFIQLGIGGIALDVTIIGKSAKGVGNPAPTDVDRFRK
jgi:hypothetical protein